MSAARRSEGTQRSTMRDRNRKSRHIPLRDLRDLYLFQAKPIDILG